MGIALFYEEHSHAGWIHKYDFKCFKAHHTLECSFGRHICGQIILIGDEYRWEEEGGMCSEGILRIKLIKEEDIEMIEAKSLLVEELPEYN